MKAFLLTLLKHPVTVICYGLYTWFCYSVVSSRHEFRHYIATHPTAHSASYGEGIAYTAFFLLIVGAIFGLVLLINAIVRKKVVFYLWLMALVFVQTLVALNL